MLCKVHFISFAHVWSPLADHYAQLAWHLFCVHRLQQEASNLHFHCVPVIPAHGPNFYLAFIFEAISRRATHTFAWVFRFCWHCWRALCSSGLGLDLQSPKSPKPERSIVERASSMECSADPGRIGGEMCNHLSCEFCRGFTCRPWADWILDRIGISSSFFFGISFLLVWLLGFWLRLLLASYPFALCGFFAVCCNYCADKEENIN